jgi:hypothetical protein
MRDRPGPLRGVRGFWVRRFFSFYSAARCGYGAHRGLVLSLKSSSLVYTTPLPRHLPPGARGFWVPLPDAEGFGHSRRRKQSKPTPTPPLLTVGRLSG